MPNQEENILTGMIGPSDSDNPIFIDPHGDIIDKVKHRLIHAPWFLAGAS